MSLACVPNVLLLDASIALYVRYSAERMYGYGKEVHIEKLQQDVAKRPKCQRRDSNPRPFRDHYLKVAP
eukprot:scaffold35355_cov101-Isochrysis_galbana.AAC.2